MRFDQFVQSVGPAPRGGTPAPRTAAMHVLSRSVVERVDDAGAVVLTITDSTAFESPGADPLQLEAAQRTMRGRWARMRVSPAGGMELLGVAPAGIPGGQDATAFAHLPGTLPEGPVPVGATWTREMALPWNGVSSLAAGGRVEVVFRLDSLGRGGTLAYLSMQGALDRAGVTQGGVRVSTSGTMNGQLRVDLKRGWMTDSRATFTLVSTLMPAPGAPKRPPAQLHVTITQRLHCVE
jgi:hypothetical protein